VTSIYAPRAQSEWLTKGNGDHGAKLSTVTNEHRQEQGCLRGPKHFTVNELPSVVFLHLLL
jgi:hypothetical protein